MIKWSAAFVLLILLSACERSPYEGYKSLGEGVYMHLYTIGDGEHFPDDGDSLLFRLRMGRPNSDVGELFSTEEWYAARDLQVDAFAQILRRIREGDSMSVIAPISSWPWKVLLADEQAHTPDTGMVRMELSLIDIRSEAMRRAADERLRNSEPYIYEQKLMHAFLKQEKVPFQRWGTSNMYYRLKGGGIDTARVMKGDLVTISYRGKNVEDGIVFDDTDRNGMPLSFRFGDKDQVMTGLGYAIELLREGQEGLFLFPSEFAFGAKGVPGIVEPNMPVIYTVRLDKVERASTTKAAH